jgi:hypothetical protein
LLQARLAALPIVEPSPSAYRIGVLVGELHKDKSPAADQAVVVLMEYYLGESNGEDLLEDTLLRGKRMIRLVERLDLGSRSACALGEFEMLKAPVSAVQNDLREILEMLRKGETIDSGL